MFAHGCIFLVVFDLHKEKKIYADELIVEEHIS
jgi:hypothetical protein